MDEVSERRFNNIRMHVLDKIAQFATDNGNMNLFMVAHKLLSERKNPFSYSDVKEAVKEVYDEVK
jgi:DNA-directed RNA polymerase delta subunit